MQVLAGLQLERQLQKALFCSLSKLVMANINAVYCAVKLVLFNKGWYYVIFSKKLFYI